jgi:hypothetical protein
MLSEPQYEALRDAIRLLTAHISDMRGESEDLGAEQWRALAMTELGDAYDDFRQAARLATGLMNLSLFLTYEIAARAGESPLAALQRIGGKIAASQEQAEDD